MIVRHGSIFDYYGKAAIVIPINIGWKKDGSNVMGRGLALYAAEKHPELPRWVGAKCMEHGSDTPCLAWPDNINPIYILFPVKPLNMNSPHESWKSMADLGLIDRSARQLSEMSNDMEHVTFAVPLVGCGNGQRAVEEVVPILARHLKSDKFILVVGD